MPAESELTSQISAYGRWLEESLSTELACQAKDPAVPASGADASLLAEPELIDVNEVATSKGQRSGVLAFAAAALIAIVGLGLVVQQTDGSGVVEPVDTTAPPTTATTTSTSTTETERIVTTRPEAADTPAPLFVLPESLDGLSTLNGPMPEFPSGDTGSGIIVGRETTTGFADIGAILFVQELSFTGNEEEAEIDGLDVLIADYGELDPSTSIGVPVPEGGWLEISSSTHEQAVALARSSVVEDGELRFVPFGGLDVIDRIDRLEARRARLLSLRDEQGSGFATIMVQSGNLDVGLPGWPGDAERITVRGVEGFRTTTVTAFGDESSLVSWIEAPGQIITVASSPNDAVDIAERLRVVDEETWFAELEALPVFDPLETAVGYPIGTFVLLNEQGDEVQFAANGEVVVVVAGASSCAECFADLDAFAALMEAQDPEARLLVVRLDTDSEWVGPDSWKGPVYSLPEPGVDLGPFDIADSLANGELLVLNPENETIARVNALQPDAVERLDVLLQLLD